MNFVPFVCHVIITIFCSLIYVMILKYWIVLYLILSVVYSKDSANKCGYASCNLGRKDRINVHIIPHTHDDVGWLKTVNQYYYGDRDNIQSAGVQYILDTVITALAENSERRFSYVEIAFFHKWWLEQTNDKKKQVIGLVNSGRLQFLLGGWSMNDEAAAHYTAIIDQLSLGLDFLNQTFGECGRPLVSWQIDPFGHSIEQANLFKLMGYDALFFSRLDYRDHKQRIAEKRMEFLQSTSFVNSKKSNNLFTSIMFDTYCTLKNFCFDQLCSDSPMIDNPNILDYNIKSKVDEFVKDLTKLSQAYSTNHVLVSMGCDFQFQNAHHNFKNIDKLIYYVNKYQNKFNLFYSTPSCYTYAVNSIQQSYTQKIDDFFPYASDPHSFWTGYFTSRPSTKGFIRYGNNIFQSCKKLYVQSQKNDKQINKNITNMAHQMGILQHHDSVTGTEKQHVADDYMMRLYNGIKNCENVINFSFKNLRNSNTQMDFEFCHLLNISYCDKTDNLPNNKHSVMAVYNSLEFTVKNWIKIPVNIGNIAKEKYHVIDLEHLKNIDFQVIPISNITYNIPERPKSSKSNYEIVFQTNIPPLGYRFFSIYKNQSSISINNQQKFSKIKEIKSKYQVIENRFIKLTYENGYLINILNKISNVSVKVNQKLAFYISNGPSKIRNSGAYIFKPFINKFINSSQPVQFKVINGDHIQEVHQTFTNWMHLVTRLYRDSDLIESEWTVGPIPIDDHKGKEVILHFDLDIDSLSSFLTDSNGRQLVTRRVNYRYDYKFNQTEPIAGNYYPIDSSALVLDKNNKKGFLIHTDRSQGGGAYQNGMLQLMLHRRCLYDDNFGVGEALNETGSDNKGLIVRGKHYFTVDTPQRLLDRRRNDSLKIFHQPLYMFSKKLINSPLNDNHRYPSYQGIDVVSTEGLHILSLENHFDLKSEVDYKIIRLENIKDNAVISVDVQKLLSKIITIKKMQEMNLSANQILKDMKELNWKLKDANKSDVKPDNLNSNSSNNIVKLNAGQIRTFRIY